MASVLMIDDDVEFCAVLRDYLQSHEIQFDCAYDAAGGLAALARSAYDLVLLDVMLPDVEGFEVLRRIRSQYALPVLLLSAAGSEENRIAGLDCGADDYLPKPFNPRELVSRIHAVLRRLGQLRMPSTPPDRSGSGFVFNHATREVFHRGRRLPLTDAEFELLTVFAESPGTILERELLVNRVFQKPFHPLDRSLDMHVSRLRRKLAAIDELADPIKTIRNAGYIFTATSLQS